MTIQNVNGTGYNPIQGTNAEQNNAVKNKKNNGIEKFSTIEYTSKKDGKTYIAKKITLTQDGKELEGIYVFDKSAKPDEKGNIQGEFMNFDTFMKKLSDELPVVKASNVSAYNPNMKTMSEEEKFDKGYNSGIKFSDGSILLRPHMLNTGLTEIKPSKNEGEYDVIFTSFVGGYKHEPTKKTLDEESLILDKSLCRGSIKQLDDNTYEVTYYTDSNFKNYDTTSQIMNKAECIEFMNKNFLYM